MNLFKSDTDRHAALATTWVVPRPNRCVQCGICSFNCPIGLDVRRFAWRGEPIQDGHCLVCGECVKRCPRGLLGLEQVSHVGVFNAKRLD